MFRFKLAYCPVASFEFDKTRIAIVGCLAKPKVSDGLSAWGINTSAALQIQVGKKTGNRIVPASYTQKLRIGIHRKEKGR